MGRFSKELSSVERLYDSTMRARACDSSSFFCAPSPYASIDASNFLRLTHTHSTNVSMLSWSFHVTPFSVQDSEWQMSR